MWQMLLHRLFGIGEPPTGVRFGVSVVALQTYAVIALCAAAGGVSWALSGNPWLALGIVGVLGLVLMVYLVGTWIFSHVHPDLAMLGGSEWRRYQERLQMGARDFPEIPAYSPVADPQHQGHPIDAQIVEPDGE